MLSFLVNNEFIKVGVGIYRHLPERISPTAFYLGSFSVNWYPLMYIAAFLTVYLLLRWRVKKGEADHPAIAGPRQGGGKLEIIDDFIFYSFWGVLVGGRLGYVLFYNLSYYWNNPSAIISPFDAAGKFIGIYGMSYHGGLIGVILTTWYFVRKNNIDFFSWADFAVPAIPAGFFFGRIGDFLNGELYGRITDSRWGMYFSADPFFLRHPSQLYEAFFEGLVLFLILWSLRNGIRYKSKMFPVPCLLLYIFLYGFFRFWIEFFRAPDPQLGFVFHWGQNGLTMGQIISLIMMAVSLFFWVYRREKKIYNRG